jgi:hypothetical protein
LEDLKSVPRTGQCVGLLLVWRERLGFRNVRFDFGLGLGLQEEWIRSGWELECGLEEWAEVPPVFDHEWQAGSDQTVEMNLVCLIGC